jgi:peptidoglycan/xylan/chitin deacetylase (PgdA/CDA1 family)
MRPSRNVLLGYLAWEPILALSRASRLRGCAVALMYHEVLPDSDPIEAWTVVRESAFRAQIQYLKENFEIVSLDQALARMRNPGRNGRPMALLTFDDGYRGNRQVVWPIVEELRAPITIFVATAAVQNQTPYWYDRVIAALFADGAMEIDLGRCGLQSYRIPSSCRGEARWTRIQRVLADLKRLSPVDRECGVEDLLRQSGLSRPAREPLKPLSIGDIQAMAPSEYVTFGAHTHGHDNLTQLAPEKVRETVLRSKTLVESWSGKAVRHFAYPFGAFNPAVAEIVQGCGFASSQATTSGFWRQDDSEYAIPRLSIGRFDSLGSFKARVSGLAL